MFVNGYNEWQSAYVWLVTLLSAKNFLAASTYASLLCNFSHFSAFFAISSHAVLSLAKAMERYTRTRAVIQAIAASSPCSG